MAGKDEVILDDGSVRKLGNLVPLKALNPDWPVFAGPTHQTARLIPESEWDYLLDQYDSLDEYHPHVQYVHDQDGVGQCNPESVCSLVEFCRSVQGLPFVKLSPADLYARVNGGRDQGSMLEDAMSEIFVNGVGTAETSGLLWKTGYYKGPASKEERARYCMLELLLCPTFRHVFSASLQGFGIVTGIPWYDNYNPGPDGWLPKPQGDWGGHAIFGYKPTRRVVNGKKEYGIWHQNSWSELYSKARKGRFVIPQSAYTGPVGGWWAGRVVADEGVPR